MLLLDIIAIPRRVLDTVRSVPKPIVRDTVTVPSDTTDTVASTLSVHGGYRQQLADAAPIPSGSMGMTGDDLFWTILAVVVALGLCFYFIKKYRRTQQQTSNKETL
jgi:hypothetical protein